ncbi:hypothetical protein [Massilia glaciei]|uniref:hypothetical protein n=1 Tax=Massilia glaciei TaxID=1524097 RepID=UPI0011B1ED5D|nr:hypothetical protein [Massilia glaciei]
MNLLRRFRLHAEAVLRFIDTICEQHGRKRRAHAKNKIENIELLPNPEHFCIIRSCLDTLRKQGHSMLAVLLNAFHCTPIQPTV